MEWSDEELICTLKADRRQEVIVREGSTRAEKITLEKGEERQLKFSRKKY